MLARTTTGKLIHIVRNESGVLWDASGLGWSRRGDLDQPGHAAYSATTAEGVRMDIQFTKDELVRVCEGTRAIQTPITVEELREMVSDTMDPEAKSLAEDKPDQWFREVMIKAEETDQNPYSLAGHLLLDELNQRKPEEVPPEASPLPPVTREEHTRYRRTPRAKLQPGGFEDTFEGKRVLLTPKQVEFMKRIGEIEETYHYDTGTWYPSDVYTECLSNTMSPTSVGAMITTLREKGVIRTEYSKVGGRKICRFQLTELGQYVYDKLSRLARGVK